MTKPLAFLLSALERTLASEPARKEAFELSKQEAEAISSLLPLVHRTGSPDQSRPWVEIFRQAKLVADSVRELEKEFGYDRAVYFFVGCGAYPKGGIALLVRQAAVVREAVTFTPFDTGAMVKGFITPSVVSASWGAEEKQRALDEHMGQGSELQGFTGPYLASHFHDPREYITRRQQSEPDFPAYHGLISSNGDRRAWTIEVHAHEDVDVPADNTALARVLLDDKDLLRDLPPAYLRLVRVRNEEDEDDLAEAIATDVLRMVERRGA